MPNEERERHYKTHFSFRPWCPVCVEAKGIEDPHHCAQHGREHEIPLVAIDYNHLVNLVKMNTTKE